MAHAIVLRIRVNDPSSSQVAYLTDALGEFARDLEAEAASATPPIPLVPDPDDPGRFAWEIVTEEYPSI